MQNYAFIDGQNLNLSSKQQGYTINYKRLKSYLWKKYSIKEIYFFIGYIKHNQRLYDELSTYGYNLIFKPTINAKGIIKGNCDAELVLHSMIQWKNYDKAIIVSNDGDFYCLIEHMLVNNKLLKVLAPSFKYSSLLRKFSKYIVPMPLIKSKIQNLEYKKRGTFPRQ